MTYTRAPVTVPTAEFNQLCLDHGPHIHSSPVGSERACSAPAWATISESILVRAGAHLCKEDSLAIAAARLTCKSWRAAFNLLVKETVIDIRHRSAEEGESYVRSFCSAFPRVHQLVLIISFRRVPRERVQACLDAHFLALRGCLVDTLQLNLDLTSFNERKVKLPDVGHLSSWSALTQLVVQESGWRSQQLRVDAPQVFAQLPLLQRITVVCKHSGCVKALFERACTTASPISTQHKPSTSDGTTPVVRSAAASTPRVAMTPSEIIAASLGRAPSASAAAAASGACFTRSLRCQITQNQSLETQLQRAFQMCDPSAVKAVTFEIVEETYAEPAAAVGPVDLSAAPGVQRLTLLNGAEDALAHCALELIGTRALRELVLFDIATGRWCYSRQGHGIPARLLASPGLAASLEQLVLAGFVLAHSPSLELLADFSRLQYLRLEQPETDTLAAVSGVLLLHALPPSLTVLKLRGVMLAPPVVSAMSHGFLDRRVSSAADTTMAHSSTDSSGSSSAIGSEGVDGSSKNGSLGCMAAATALTPLPNLRALYLSRCKIPSFAAFGRCPSLSKLGIINCLGGPDGLGSAASAFPMVAELSVIFTLSPEMEQGMPSHMGPGTAPQTPMHMLPHAHMHAALHGQGLHGTAAGPSVPQMGGALPHAAGISLPIGQHAGLQSSHPHHRPLPQQQHTLTSSGSSASHSHMQMPHQQGSLASNAQHHPGMPLAVKRGPAPMPHAVTFTSGTLLGAAAAGGAGAQHGQPILHHSFGYLPAAWGAETQVAALSSFSKLRNLQYLVPRCGSPTTSTSNITSTSSSIQSSSRAVCVPALVAALSALPRLIQLDLALPCGQSERLLALAPLTNLQRLTLWTDPRAMQERSKARQLQALQRSLAGHMPSTSVEWAVADLRTPSWSGLEGSVFSPY